MSSILLVALGCAILFCPEAYIGSLTLVLGYSLVVIAIVMILNFLSGNKSLMEYIKFTGALILSIVGLSVLVYSDDDQMIDLISVIEELEKVTNEELDFRVEANNTKFFKENCIEDENKITCPTVIDELTTERIFTMTFVDGYTISHKDRIIEDGFVDSVIALGATSAKTDRDKLIEDAQLFLSKYTNTTSISDMDMSDLFDEITDLASRHSIKLPGQFTMLGRAVLSIEGVIEQLSPELDLFNLLSTKMIERSKKNFDVKQTLLDAGKDIIGVGKKTAKIPGLVADTLHSLAKGKAKINMEITGIDEPLERIGVYFKYVVLAFIACILFMGSCILATVDLQPKTSNGMPLIAMVGIVFSIALAIYSVGKLTKKKND